jgi:hypothetical protein
MFAALPERIQEIATAAYATFLNDPDHPSLRHHRLKATKKGHLRKNSWAIAVTARYRAIYCRDGPTNVWYWIGSHEDYNQFAGNF